MKMIALAPSMDSDQLARAAFLAERLTGIGGSDAAVVLGLSPYRSAVSLWKEKTGQVPSADLSGNEDVEWGVLLEPVILTEYAKRTGKRVHKPGLYRHPDHAWMIAHLDGEVIGESRGIEIKTADRRALEESSDWGPDGSAEIPISYYCQVQHSMAVSGHAVFDLPVLFGGRRLRIYTVARDDAFIAEMIVKEAAFWNAVKARVQPALTTEADANDAFPFSRAISVEATTEIVELVTTMSERKAAMEALEAEFDGLRARVKAFMGDGEALVHGKEKLATWKTSRAFSEQRAKEIAPAAFAESVVESFSAVKFKSLVTSAVKDMCMLPGAVRPFSLK